MKILQLSNKFPYPLKDGAAIAITYLAKAYADLGHEVALLSMNTSKHWFDLKQLPPHFDHYAAIETVFIDNHIRPWAAFCNLIASDSSYHVERFDHSEFAQRLTDRLRQTSYDVVQLESLYLTPYIPVIRQHSTAKIVLRAHNVEHEIWERVAANTTRFFHRWYLNRITPRLKAYEIAHLNDYDLVAAITARDAAHLRRLGLSQPVVVTPIGLDCHDYTPDLNTFHQPLSLSFIGSLDWMPNQEGLRWFLDKVWMQVLLPQFPELTFHIAGRTAPPWIRALRLPGVHFHGEVESASEFINRHPVMVVPLLSGGGMRAKILEGMALGKVVLSTRIGMEGIEAHHERECLLADTPEDFANSIRWCLNQGSELAVIGQNAAAFCAAHYDNLRVAERLADQFRKLINEKTRAEGSRIVQSGK